MTIEDNCATLKMLDLHAVPEGMEGSKIRKVQERDRWRAEKSQSIPLDFRVVGVESVLDPKGNASNPQYIMQLEAGGLTWSQKFSLNDLADFSKNLSKAFPIEAGKVGKHKRILPESPTWIKRNILGGPTKKAKQLISAQVKQYIDDVLGMPKYILQSRLATEFFLKPGDTVPSTPPPSTSASQRGGDLSTFETSSTSEEPCSPVRVKIKIGAEMVVVNCMYSKGYECLLEQVQKKFVHVYGESFVCPHRFAYSNGNGEEILVEDDEDLQIACILNPYLLILTGSA